MNLRGSLGANASSSYNTETHQLTPTAPVAGDSGPEEHIDSEDEDLLTAVSKYPHEQRLLALENYVFEKHAAEIPKLHAKQRHLEDQLAVLANIATDLQAGLSSGSKMPLSVFAMTSRVRIREHGRRRGQTPCHSRRDRPG